MHLNEMFTELYLIPKSLLCIMDAKLNEIESWAERKSQKGAEGFLFGFFVCLFSHEYFSEVRGDLRYYTLRFMCHDCEEHSS